MRRETDKQTAARPNSEPLDSVAPAREAHGESGQQRPAGFGGARLGLILAALCRMARGAEQDAGRTGLHRFYRRGRRGCPWRALRGWRRRPGGVRENGLASGLAGRVGSDSVSSGPVKG
jgi:hypothetical protein